MASEKRGAFFYYCRAVIPYVCRRGRRVCMVCCRRSAADRQLQLMLVTLAVIRIARGLMPANEN